MGGFRNRGYLSRGMLSLSCLTLIRVSNTRGCFTELYVCSNINGFTLNTHELCDTSETQRRYECVGVCVRFCVIQKKVRAR